MNKKVIIFGAESSRKLLGQSQKKGFDNLLRLSDNVVMISNNSNRLGQKCKRI